MMSSVGIDYDGDGNTSEGIYDELVGLRDKLGTAIRTYGSEHDAPICYAANSYPYWFIDGNRDGSCSADGGGDLQRLRELDPAPAARHLQLPDGEQGSGRVRPQREVHHRAALRRDHRRQRRAGRQGRHEQGDAHRLRPLQRRQRGGPPLGPGRGRSTRPARRATAARTASASTCSTTPARWFRRPRTASSAAPATTSPAPTSRRSSRSRR